MAGSHEKNIFAALWENFNSAFIPKRGDKPSQIVFKLLFFVSVITLIISACYLTGYFISGEEQQSIIEDSRTVWHSTQITEEERFSELIDQNPDFKAWISISNTQIDNPVYQTADNEYYLDHNQNKQSSRYGALFFEAEDEVDSETDKNLVIYGHNMKDGSMFGTLRKLRNLSFYKANPTISLSTAEEDSLYVIYSVFLLNAVPADDNGYIYDINKSSFLGQDDFDSWRDEAITRSIINTDIDVQYGDDILTLVTCAEDFDDARLVVMARKLRTNESVTVDTSAAKVNGSPRHPKRWYDDRNIAFPYES